MAVYAIGDVQGCFDELQRLLDLVGYRPRKDRIWLAGDMVNRGPKSAKVLRFAMKQQKQIRTVLGNHDLHLLATAAGVKTYFHPMDTLRSVLEAKDCAQLIDWLRHQPLFYHDKKLGFSMVHAGVPAMWTIEEALEHAHEVETILRSDNWREFFHHMYGNTPDKWSPKLKGWDRLRFITNCFTRLRYCHRDGRLALKLKGKPKNTADREHIPWFEMPDRQTQDDKIVFGHWSTLGTGRYGNVFSLDSGAVWGDALTALRIDKKPYQWFTVKADPEGLPYAKNKIKTSR